ncbi:hypothetical protein TIFTF001_055022 [Ficus carica]|uniref:Uncharacterized protein n=1 Tax=Ficus carica TaxID=3494 RepID=A0AA88EHB2_FICCA|nr:hypothetical protein TIFTF001_055022 [Ficus carica]
MDGLTGGDGCWRLGRSLSRWVGVKLVHRRGWLPGGLGTFKLTNGERGRTKQRTYLKMGRRQSFKSVGAPKSKLVTEPLYSYLSIWNCCLSTPMCYDSLSCSPRDIAKKLSARAGDAGQRRIQTKVHEEHSATEPTGWYMFILLSLSTFSL